VADDSGAATLAGEHTGADAALRFLAEAEAVARIQHPNVVQIHNLGETDGLPFVELEFAPGGSLEKQLDGVPWAPRAAARTIEALGDRTFAPRGRRRHPPRSRLPGRSVPSRLTTARRGLDRLKPRPRPGGR
jgi:hypothetical protein